MQEYENPDSLEIKYLDELAFECYMQVASIQFATEDNPYVPEVHHLTIIDCGKALNKAGRREAALNLTPELKDAFFPSQKMQWKPIMQSLHMEHIYFMTQVKTKLLLRF